MPSWRAEQLLAARVLAWSPYEGHYLAPPGQERVRARLEALPVAPPQQG
ncbi:hypothetical protein [Hyalangium rubrum]|uniref:Uncharacterized protein n=1 Tax=Hyalangium rubrum TaxID=3103134 RepID=A0ABU5H395_9BACT|nr:hypothetical protein [Hyalangium sp. s54d21]MDY7227369.1 hypothetical protein [Hyalangium sp. s54d21]